MCEGINSVVINFDQESAIWLNLIVAFIMFGVALDIQLKDFKLIAQQPRMVLIGLTSEYILLPILTLLMIYFFQPPPSFALGMILLTACPGGSASNYMVHLAKGNTALSITLTSITTIGAIFLTPFGVTMISQIFPYTSEFLETINVSPLEMIKSIIIIVAIPICTGMFCRARFPEFTEKIKRPIGTASMIIFLCFVFIAIYMNWEHLSTYIHCVFLIVAIHNGLALLTGFQFARLMGLSRRNARAVSLETGIQNTALGLAIVFQFFDGLGGMALVLAWWGIWHLITGFGLAFYWRRKAVD